MYRLTSRKCFFCICFFKKLQKRDSDACNGAFEAIFMAMMTCLVHEVALVFLDLFNLFAV